MKKYLKTTKAGRNGATVEIEISIFYDLGGMSYFSGQSSPRGYYLAVRPVERGGGFISFGLFQGLKALLVEVKRQSPKALGQAEALAATKESELIAKVLQAEGLTLESETKKPDFLKEVIPGGGVGQ